MLYLVRHGRTAANASGQLLGHLDLVLDEEGRAQAKAAAAVLPREALVISSPLARALETAEGLGSEVTIDGRWIELDYGQLDGVSLSDVDAETWKRWRSDPDFNPGGGESLSQLGRRVAAACEDLSERARSGDVIVVSHVSPIKAAVAWALDVGDEVAWRTYVAPASITTIRVEALGPVLASFNETAHLSR